MQVSYPSKMPDTPKLERNKTELLDELEIVEISCGAAESYLPFVILGAMSTQETTMQIHSIERFFLLQYVIENLFDCKSEFFMGFKLYKVGSAGRRANDY